MVGKLMIRLKVPASLTSIPNIRINTGIITSPPATPNRLLITPINNPHNMATVSSMDIFDKTSAFSTCTHNSWDHTHFAGEACQSRYEVRISKYCHFPVVVVGMGIHHCIDKPATVFFY